MIKVTSCGVGFCLIIYIFVGIIGYLMYGSECTQAILTNFGNDMKEFQGKDNFILGVLTVINIGFLISSSMTFPLMFFTLKKNFINSIIFCKNKFTAHEDYNLRAQETVNFNYSQYLTGNEEESSISDKKKNAITTILYLSIFFVSVVIKDLDIIINLVGSTATNAIVFIMPNLFLLKLSRTLHCNFQNIISKLLLILGIIMLFSSLILRTYKTIRDLNN